MGISKGNQIAAARALLGWDQKDIAARVGVTVAAISKIEKGENKGKSSTLAGIHAAFELSGVIFTENGVEYKPDGISIIEGENWYVRLLDDVYNTLSTMPNSELLILCGDDRLSTPDVNAAYRKIRGSGVRMRQLVENGNTYLMGTLDEYRYIPKDRFKNYVSLIYGGKVAVCTEANTKALVFKDHQLAKAWTNLFDVLWDTLSCPERSDADERF